MPSHYSHWAAEGLVKTSHTLISIVLGCILVLVRLSIKDHFLQLVGEVLLLSCQLWEVNEWELISDYCRSSHMEQMLVVCLQFFWGWQNARCLLECYIAPVTSSLPHRAHRWWHTAGRDGWDGSTQRFSGCRSSPLPVSQKTRRLWHARSATPLSSSPTRTHSDYISCRLPLPSAWLAVFWHTAWSIREWYYLYNRMSLYGHSHIIETAKRLFALLYFCAVL